MKNNRKIENLFLKAKSHIGMLNEAVSKAKLIKNKVSKAKVKGNDTEEFIKEVQGSMERIRKDMAKYSDSIKKICEELKSYGISVENME